MAKHDVGELKVFENGLIKVYETDIGELIVDGRELWQGVGSKQEFANWVKNRLDECDAKEGEDFLINLSKTPEKGGRPSKEYIIKLDTAKEMAMLEHNDIGKQYRKYLIEVEKKYRELVQNPFKNLSPELQAIFVMDGKVQQVEQRVDKLENTMTIDYEQKQELQDIAADRVIMVLGGKEAPAYRSLSKKAFSACWIDYKRYMRVNSYANTAVVDFEKGKAFLVSWMPDEKLQALIFAANNGFRFQGK